MSRQKTVLRTVRIAKDLDDLIQKDARAKRISVNSLVAAIFMKYCEWDRFAEKYGYASIPKNFLRDLLDSLDEEKLLAIAEKSGAEHPNEVIHFWFKNTSLETLLSYIRIHADYCNLMEVEIENDTRNYTISLQHNYGRKWSKFLERFFDKMLRTHLKVTPHFETTENNVTLKFELP